MERFLPFPLNNYFEMNLLNPFKMRGCIKMEQLRGFVKKKNAIFLIFCKISYFLGCFLLNQGVLESIFGAKSELKYFS